MAVPTVRLHGLYHPYFSIRDERWLKVAALYWPKIVRLIPEDHRPNDSDTVRALTDELGFIDQVPPGASVQAVAPRFLELLERASMRRFRLEDRYAAGTVPTLATIHAAEIDARVREGLFARGLAVGYPGRMGARSYDRSREAGSAVRWMAMDEHLVKVYKSVLAENFADANGLQPTTDEESAYAAANNWDTDRIEAALTGQPIELRPARNEALADTLAYLALELVIPGDIEEIPVEKIIEIRLRYGAEFQAYGDQVAQIAADLAELQDVRDAAVLSGYLQEAVENRFAQPLTDLRKQLRALKLDAATMVINIKTEIPAGIAAFGGGALLARHPLVAATGSAAIGLLAVRRRVRQEQDRALRAAPASSFLLHTEQRLRPRRLIQRTLDQVQRIAGTDAG